MSYPMKSDEKAPPHHGPNIEMQSGYPNAPPIVEQPGFQQAGYSVAPGYQPIPQQPVMFAGGPHGQQPMPIMTQGGPGMVPPNQWMVMPTTVPANCPRGLEYLAQIDQLIVQQKVELMEAFTGFETNNKYKVKNTLGQNVYFAIEDNDCCTRNCCGPARPFDMKIFDNFRTEVLHLYRPLACSACCFPCCLQTMEISSPPGTVIGKIEQEWTICYPQFRLKNDNDEVVMRIEGPLCRCAMCGDVDFKILSMTGEEIGKISKQWSGLARELFTDSDTFGLTFPLNLDVKMKATLLGACFLIDFMFFEDSGDK